LIVELLDSQESRIGNPAALFLMPRTAKANKKNKKE
jgi:hypothetical protein